MSEVPLYVSVDRRQGRRGLCGTRLLGAPEGGLQPPKNVNFNCQLQPRNVPLNSRDGDAEQLLHRNVLRFRGGLVFKAHRRCVSLNSRLESNNEEEKGTRPPATPRQKRQS